jgi:hypothetical protein
VKRSGLAWTWETESPAGANVESTPLMSNGVLYGSHTPSRLAVVVLSVGSRREPTEPWAGT